LTCDNAEIVFVWSGGKANTVEEMSGQHL